MVAFISIRLLPLPINRFFLPRTFATFSLIDTTMHLASLSPIIGSLLLAWLPLSNAAAGEGPTFCQSVDKLKVTSPLTFIRPVPSFNLKWSPDICLCQADGELTDATVERLNAKITSEGVSKLAKKLGLDTLPDYWEEMFVRQAVIDAADAFVSRVLAPDLLTRTDSTPVAA